jgi:DNA-binding MarR family transcriptional regulator
MPERATDAVREKQQKFVFQALNIIAGFHSGETTLNQLRVAQYINWQSGCLGKSPTHRDITEALGIPGPTVTRAIAKFIAIRWLVEKPDPADGRKRISTMNPLHPHKTGTLDWELLSLAARTFKAEDRIEWLRSQGYTITGPK